MEQNISLWKRVLEGYIWTLRPWIVELEIVGVRNDHKTGFDVGLG